MKVLKFGGKMYIVLVYDIGVDDNGAKRWRKTFKVCKQYLHHIQNSVFEGDITKAQLYALKSDINSIIDEEIDSVIVFKSRQQKWLEKEIFGQNKHSTSNFL